MIATNIQQSKHLLRLGLDPKTADMTIGIDYKDKERLIADKIRNIQKDLEEIGYYDLYDIDYFHVLQPAWSLTALLEVMPSFIDYKGQKLRLTIEKAGIWNVFYLGTEHRLNEIWFNGEYGNPVEPAYKMVCWLLEQGLIKKGGQDDNNHQ